MPITEQLKTSEQLQQAGLPHAAAVLLAEKIEAAAQSTHDTALEHFRTEVRTELAALRAELATRFGEIGTRFGEIGTRFADVEKSIRTSQTVILSAIGILVAVVAAFGTAILTAILRH
jgi:hypothetical protein